MAAEHVTSGAVARRHGSQREAACWLVVGASSGEVFTINGRKTLPVFSFPEEAEMFVWFELGGGDWRLREVAADELLLVLLGPCAGAERVALDPPPRAVADGVIDLVSLSRKRFEDFFLEKVLDG